MKIFQAKRELGNTISYPPPPTDITQSDRPEYNFQYLHAGAYQPGKKLKIQFTNGTKELEQKISVARIRRIGVRLGAGYTFSNKQPNALQPAEAEEETNDESGNPVAEPSGQSGIYNSTDSMLEYEDGGFNFGLLYGLGFYLKPTVMNVSSKTYRQPAHLFIGTTYNKDNGFIDALLNEEKSLDTYIGIGFDVSNGIGIMAGAHFGKRFYPSFNDQSFTWSMEEGYGYNGFFTGISGDLRLEKLLNISLFSKEKE
jgi:hypothetical protein